MKTRQLGQVCLRRSLETTLSLSISDWLDDFINHQPSDELGVRQVFSQQNRLIYFDCFVFFSLRSSQSHSLVIADLIGRQFCCQQVVSEQFDLPKNKKGKEIRGRRNGSVEAISQIVEDKLSSMVHDHGGIP